jgi:hypothetical protein
MKGEPITASYRQLNLLEPTLEEIYQTDLPTMATRIWKTCQWAERGSGSWRIGDYKFLLISITPEPGTTLWVQFWSEPDEDVVAEVCSGEWAPDALKYVQQRQREIIRSLGYDTSERAKNFRKVISIRSAAEAEQVARETLRIFYDCFDYRGQWPLAFHGRRGGRAESVPVYQAMTPEDFAKLVASDGYIATVAASADDGPVVLAQRGGRQVTARLYSRIPKSGLYRVIVLDAVLDPGRPISDRTLAELNGALRDATVVRHGVSEIAVSAMLRLEGGVTTTWILRSVDAWHSAVCECERSLQGDQGCTNSPKSPKSQEHVH